MRKIRYTFETNSSSCHGLMVKAKEDIDESYLRVRSDGCIHSQLGEFGWGYDRYDNQETKLSYALTMVAESEGFNEESEGFKMISDLIKEKTGCDLVIDSYCGYIDHQSCYPSLKDFLDDWGISLERFIFDGDVELIIDNDNH